MKRLDPITLDRLVTGRHDLGDAEAWQDLVTKPGGAEAWTAALARRAEADRHAALIIGRPWLAAALLAIRRLARRIENPGVAMTAHVTAPVLAAVLGPAVEGGKPIEVPWGAIRTMDLRIGEVVRFEAASGVLLWQTAAAEGILSPPGWRMEPGDSPVLILVIQGAESGPLAMRIGAAEHIGGVILSTSEIGENPE